MKTPKGIKMERYAVLLMCASELAHDLELAEDEEILYNMSCWAYDEVCDPDANN